VLLLGVAVGVVRAQDDAAFLVLDDNTDPDPNDFDPAVLADSRGRAVEAFENLQKSGGTLSRETFADDPNTPPAYLAKVSGATALQKESQSRQDNSLTASSVLTSPAAERLAVEARPAAIYPCHYYKPQYHCDHQTYILTYFPLGNYAICFIPWASEQRITYVRCRCSRCNIRPVSRSPLRYDGQGRCRPSCYQRRRVMAWCWNRRTGRPFWYTRTFNLPQACSCSTC
ncbi:hypothetical protein BaRGS_00037148, partial [Batillaria attramentaria]